MTKTKFKQTEIGLIPEDWEVVKIDSVGEVITGKTPPTKDKDNYGNKYMFVKIPDFGNSVYIINTNTKLSSKGAEYMKRLKISKESVMVSCIATIGKVGIASEDCFTNQQINSITPDENRIKSKWIYYFFKNNKNYLKSNGGGGSVYNNISKSKFQNLSISLPELEEQERISNILFNLDSRIELLQKQNETLEKIGQAIFKHWFVDFEFPNEEGKPYKSSGGKMVKSELGEIPEGWQILKLGDISSEITRGFTTSYVEKSNLINLNQKVNRGKYLDKSNYKYYPEKTEVPKNKFAKYNDILINSLGQGTLGRVHIYLEKTKNVVVDQHITILRMDENNCYPEYIYYNLSNHITQNRLESQISGSTGMLMLNISKIRNFGVLIPTLKLTKQYSLIMRILHEKKSYNIGEIENLQKIRDLLLPKLMTGKIRVPLEVPK